MTIEIGASIKGIIQRDVNYVDAASQSQVMHFRDVTFEIVGLPAGAPAIPFTISVNDATQWDTLQVGQTCTITITPPP